MLIDRLERAVHGCWLGLDPDDQMKGNSDGCGAVCITLWKRFQPESAWDALDTSEGDCVRACARVLKEATGTKRQANEASQICVLRTVHVRILVRTQIAHPPAKVDHPPCERSTDRWRYQGGVEADNCEVVVSEGKCVG